VVTNDWPNDGKRNSSALKSIYWFPAAH